MRHSKATTNELYSHDLAHGKKSWRELFDAGHSHQITNERRADGTPITIDGDYICLYDAAGRRIRSLYRGTMEAGQHVAIWEGTDENGMSVSPGIYFSVLRSGGELRSRKILLVD